MSILDFYSIATQLRDCICDSLEDAGWTGDCYVAPGSQVAFDSCCDSGGQAWVSFKTAVPTITFPRPDPIGSSMCDDGHTLRVDVEVGVLRCVCTEGCTSTKLEADAAAVFTDAQALLEGIICCFGPEFTTGCGIDWRLQALRFLGPEGGCAGSAIDLALNVEPPCCS